MHIIFQMFQSFIKSPSSDDIYIIYMYVYKYVGLKLILVTLKPYLI